MYLRHTIRKQDGKVHRYWCLVRSVRIVRIPTIATTYSDASRPPATIDRDQCEGAVGCIC